MKITRIELYYVTIPLSGEEPGLFSRRTAFHPNWIPGFRQTDLRFYLLRLRADSGHEGHAAMPAMNKEREGLGALLGPYLLGLNPLDMTMVNQRIQEFAYIGMRNGWMDAAFWDLAGKIRGEPLWKMLGGSGGHVAPYASLGSAHGHDPRAVAALVRERCAQGFQGVKIRVKSCDLARMVDVVAAARAAAGPDRALMVDANLGWPVELLEPSPRWDEDFAARFAQAIEPYDVAWLEEPLHRLDFEGLSRLRRRTRTPIAGGEMNACWRDFLSMLDRGSLDVYQPDAVLAGGTVAGGISVVHWLIREIARRNERRAEGERPVRYRPHTWTNGLGFAVNLQLAGVCPPEERGLFEMPYDEHWTPDLWAKFIRGGFPRDQERRLRIPDGPGLGVEIDWGVIERYGERLYVGTTATVAAATLRDVGLREALYLRRKKQELLGPREHLELHLPEPPSW
jgi:L-alanine-DL-glutamate epimerase-like enolase superfamily enzyme